MSRPTNTQARRQQIVDGLLRVMAERGYERATIAAIAQAAGLTSGLVHYHFSTKQAVLLELVEQLAERLNARFHSLLREESPQARLEAFIDARLASGQGADPAAVACWVAVGSEALRQPEVGDIYRRLMHSQRQQLEELLRALPTPPARPQEAAVAILATIEGCYQLLAAVPDLAPPGFAARTVQAMTRGLLGTEVRRTDPS
jgi:TetR/AcrR family transcriptional repressor of bet genes